MKPKYFYGVDDFGNVHAFKSKGYRNELIDMNMIESLPAKGLNTYMSITCNRYLLVHNDNDFNVYQLVRFSKENYTCLTKI